MFLLICGHLLAAHPGVSLGSLGNVLGFLPPAVTGCYSQIAFHMRAFRQYMDELSILFIVSKWFHLSSIHSEEMLVLVFVLLCLEMLWQSAGKLVFHLEMEFTPQLKDVPTHFNTPKLVLDFSFRCDASTAWRHIQLQTDYLWQRVSDKIPVWVFIKDPSHRPC